MSKNNGNNSKKNRIEKENKKDILDFKLIFPGFFEKIEMIQHSTYKSRDY